MRPATTQMARERQRGGGVAVRQDHELRPVAQNVQILPGLEIDDEIDLVATSGETGGKPSPHAFRAAADERMRVEQQSAGRHRSNRAQSLDIPVVGDRRGLWKRAAP